jgi:peptidyl-prolyl cis-trans isomerase SurA
MKRFLLIVAAAGAFAAGAVAAAEKAAPRALLIDGVAAYVNEAVITIAEVMAEVRGSVWADLPAADREQQLHQLYKATLDAMINRRLILDSAKASGATIAPWAVDERVQEVVNRQFGGDRAKLTAALAAQRTTLEDWRKTIEEELIVQSMRYSRVEKNVTVSAQAVRDYYGANPRQFSESKGVGVSVIVIAPVEGSTVAERGGQAVKDLEAGKPFAEVAKAYSADAKAANGGDWGVINPAETFRPELADAVSGLSVGGHSPLLLLEDHGYILRKNSEVAPQTLTLEQAWPRVEGRLKMIEAEKKYVEWVNRLRKKAYIKVFELPLAK